MTFKKFYLKVYKVMIIYITMFFPHNETLAHYSKIDRKMPIYLCTHSTIHSERWMSREDTIPVALLRTPSSIIEMMKDVSFSLIEARKDRIPVVRVDIPLPVTGGTELDDWPGGIKQKYATLKPMLAETMKGLNFTDGDIAAKNYLGEDGKVDAVGVWEGNGYRIVCFPTPSSIPMLQKSLQWSDGSTLLVLVNQQLFLDPLSSRQSKAFLASAVPVYVLENISSRGPGALPVRGLVYRQYPHPFQVRMKVS